MSELPVREIVLYKHGVGYFLREGTLNTSELELTFHQDEINDVLKSLTVLDKAGGQVLGIHYQTPMDIAVRLASSSIRLSDDESLHNLIRDLRGRQVTLTIETIPGTSETITGRVIGLDKIGDDPLQEQPRNKDYLTVLTESAQVRIIPFAALRSFDILDLQSAHDMQYFLDTSKGEDNRRTVAVQLSPGDHQLIVSYVAPSPTWRVSYRIIADSESDGQSGKALIQGWGLFDNRLDEDLDNVAVTLVAGQPISFIYDLYASRIPRRPTVEDESRVAPGPIEYLGVAHEGAAQFSDDADLLKKPDSPVGSASSGPVSTERAVPRYKSARTDYMHSALSDVRTHDTGEFFQYSVKAPVSVKRGQSALVPIIGAEVSYRRELLYNHNKLIAHPVAALRFQNTTGLTLERGPVTVVENGDYKGEAVIAFTKEKNDIYIPYAVELGVRVVENYHRRTENAGLNIRGSYLVYDEYDINDYEYVLENTTGNPLTVIIEAPVIPLYELFDTQQPSSETATDRRWNAEVPAHGKTNFRQQLRLRIQRREELRKLSYQNLQKFLENRWLDRATFDRLSEMLDALSTIQRAKAEQETLNTKRATLYSQQEQLRANLSALNPTGQEAALRNRMLSQLETTQDQLEALDKRRDELEQEVTAAEKRVEQIIAELG